MLQELFNDFEDFSGKSVLIGLSGGINSAAVLCWLASYPEDLKPEVLHLYYAHFKQHSPDTLQFVLDLWSFAESRFKKVIYTQTDNDILTYFKGHNMIPHRKFSPCSLDLKILPMVAYKRDNGIDVDLIGYVKEEVRRMHRKEKHGKSDAAYPLIHTSNEFCFQLVAASIGWYPAIYDITKRKRGKAVRVFKHNNCLPCKNMGTGDFKEVEKYYPDLYREAMQAAEDMGRYWGDNKSLCMHCKFD